MYSTIAPTEHTRLHRTMATTTRKLKPLRIARQILTYVGATFFIILFLASPVLVTHGRFQAIIAVNAIIFGPILGLMFLWLIYHDIGTPDGSVQESIDFGEGEEK